MTAQFKSLLLGMAVFAVVGYGMSWALDESLPKVPPPSGQRAAYSNFKGRVVSVADGDTLTILSEGGEKPSRVRLWGIDAPENWQPYSKEAKAHLEDLVKQRALLVEVQDIDKYDRLVAIVSYGIDDQGTRVKVNTDLVAKGSAWWFRKYAPRAQDLELWEKRAREGKRGLWALPGPVAPWEWRAK